MPRKARRELERIADSPAQAKDDPNFSTVKYPNPEENAAFELAINLAQKVDAI